MILAISHALSRMMSLLFFEQIPYRNVGEYTTPRLLTASSHTTQQSFKGKRLFF